MNWGLLSTAHINRRLIPAIRAAEDSVLLAVASRDQARAEAYAAEWVIPRAYGSYEAFLADPDIDAVYISLPNSLHAEWAIQAAEAGKHVLCEKPLALGVEECDRIAAAADDAGVIAAEAVMYLYHPLMHRARDLVREGAIGRLTLVRGSFSFVLEDPRNVRLQPELGGGSLWDVGSYPVSFIRHLAGEPDEVLGCQVLGASSVDETFAGVLRCKDDVLGCFDCGFQGHLRVQAEAVGTEGSLWFERPYFLDQGARLLLKRDCGEEEVVVPLADPYQCEVEAVEAAAMDGTPLPVPLPKSRANVATLVALYDSARSGRWQQVSEGR
jgi:xylose dehydrogenase (NAD/NADP)